MKRLGAVMLALLTLTACGSAKINGTHTSYGRQEPHQLEWETTEETAPVTYTDYYQQWRDPNYKPETELIDEETPVGIQPAISSLPVTMNGGRGFEMVWFDPEANDLTAQSSDTDDFALYLWTVPYPGDAPEGAGDPVCLFPLFEDYPVPLAEQLAFRKYTVPHVENGELRSLSYLIRGRDGEWKEDAMSGTRTILLSLKKLAPLTSPEEPMYIVTDTIRTFYVIGSHAYHVDNLDPSIDPTALSCLGSFVLPEDEELVIIKWPS